MQEVLDLLKIFWPFLVLQILLMVWAIIDLIRRREVKGLPRWAWILIIVFINIFGPIIYLVFGRGEE
ncbi:MAG: PLD nuclease N-terminal domain-containing protein [Bacillota bacterium]|nr:PLD nuclease N-terminal domain-containing protein [Bacillota bacterium]